MANKRKKFSRRTVALLWIAAIGILIAALIMLQQIPILYVLATLSLVVLLLIVAFSDLEKVGREGMDSFASGREP